MSKEIKSTVNIELTEQILKYLADHTADGNMVEVMMAISNYMDIINNDEKIMVLSKMVRDLKTDDRNLQ